METAIELHFIDYADYYHFLKIAFMKVKPA